MTQNQCLPILIRFHSQTTRGLGVGLTVGLAVGEGVTGGVTGIGVAVAAGVGDTGDVIGAVIGNPPRTFEVLNTNNGKIIVAKAIAKAAPFVFNLIMRNYRRFILLSQAGFVTSILAFGGWFAVAYEIPKVVVFQWFVRLLALFLVVSFIKKPRTWKVDGKIATPLVVFLALSVVTSLFGSNTLKSFQGNYYRGDGLVTFFSLISFAFIVNYFWEEKLKIYFSEAVFVATTTVSIIALAAPFMPFLSKIQAGTFGNSVFLAGFLVVCLPLSFYYIKVSEHKFLKLFLILQVFAIFALKVTAPIIILPLFVCLLINKYSKVKYKKVIISLLLIFASVTAVLWLKNYHLDNTNSFIAEGRTRIFINGMQGLVKRPFQGYGFSNFDLAFQTGNWPLKFNDDVYVDKAHSEIFEILVTTGVFGLLAYLLFVARIYSKLKIDVKTDWGFTIKAVFLLYLVHSQTNVTSIAEQILFWFVVGYALSEIKKKLPRQNG